MKGGLNDDAAWRTENVGAALAAAAAVFERAVLRATREGEFGWVSQVQLALFRNLDLEGTHLTELAARARITKQSMQELVDQSESAGVVERRPSLRDRRVKIVAFTPRGLRMLEQFRQGVVDAESRMTMTLGAEFVVDAKSRLHAYVDALDPATAEPDPAAQVATSDRPADGPPS